MNQIYNNDPCLEVGFFYEMANLLNGVKRKEQFNAFPCYQVQCPKCGKHAARMVFSLGHIHSLSSVLWMGVY